MTGSLEIFSSTGGLLSLSKPLIRGTRIKVMFLTQKGPVLGSAEMLTPVSWTQQPFRFVTLAHSDQRRLQALTGSSLKVEMPVPEQVRHIPEQTDHIPVQIGPAPEQARRIPERTVQMVQAEPDWIDKYRAAISQNPPRRPLFERMLEALTPDSD